MSEQEIQINKANDQIEGSKVKNTFETQNQKNSKNDTEIDQEQLFKIERKKYLQQRMNNRRQMKKNKKKQFGSSSSESQQEKLSTILNNVILQKNPQKSSMSSSTCQDQREPDSLPSQKLQTNDKKKQQQEQFRRKHQQYIKQKLARKKQIIQIKKKQFGSSSSDSDNSDDLKVVNKEISQIKVQQTSNKHHEVQIRSLKSQKSFKLHKIEQPLQLSSPKKRIFKSPNSLNNLSPYNSFPSTKNFVQHDRKQLSILVQSKKNFQWVQDNLIIENKKIRFANQNLDFLINFITKIKLFFSYPSGFKQYMKMKITYKNDDIFFAVSKKKLIENLPQYYYVFSRIVNDKLTLIGIEPKKSQSSMFPNYMNLRDTNNLLTNSSLVYGYILKKSKYLNNWQTRFVSLTPNQILSSKRPSQKPTMIIQCKDISELWTRFDIESGNMLNVKIMYNSKKTQFGIPISYFQNQYNWLYCFYKIIAGKKS